MSTDDHKSAAQLEREVQAQRSRLENTIDEISERLSPGQLVDQVMEYAKSSGGADFANNFGRSLRDNPMPVALLGVSLAWLMASQGRAPATTTADVDYDGYNDENRSYRDATRSYGSNSVTSSYGDDYDDDDGLSLARIAGNSLRRTGYSTHESGHRLSDFVDESGRKFHAFTDAMGNRAGHFTDEAGNRVKGFTDEAGNQITHFMDEAGNRLDEATGWAAHTWHDARDQAKKLQRRAMSASNDMRRQAQGLTDGLLNTFKDQPLVGGALAFAVGAALGGALPRTEQEDKVFGEAADSVKKEVSHVAGDLYTKGKDQVGQIYEQAGEKLGELQETGKETSHKALDDAQGAAESATDKARQEAKTEQASTSSPSYTRTGTTY